MRAHALLSASGAKRWLACPPSARLEENFPETTSAYAEEGTEAHSLAEAILKAESPTDLLLQDVSIEMRDAVLTYVNVCEQKMEGLGPDGVVLIEQRLDFSDWVPDGFGTGDMVIVSNGVLEIVDLKYGRGIPVSAEDNPQMRLYALGAYAQFEPYTHIRSVRMTIVQPRLDSVSTAEMNIDELLAWGEEIRPIAMMAMKGEGSYKAGEHCRFCKAKYECKARAEFNLDVLKYDLRQKDLLTEYEISDILKKVDSIKSWVDDIKQYALDRALSGARWPGYKLVEGRSTRKITNDFEAVRRLTGAGYDEAVLFERNLVGITALEKIVGKKNFESLLGDLILKPTGKPVLVESSDKRAELNTNLFD